MKQSAFSVILLLAAVTLFAQQEIMQIDPAVQGIWCVWKVSYDLGQTTENGYGESVFRVFGTYAIAANGERIDFSHI